MENDPEFNLDQKVDNALYPDIKAELSGVDIDLPNQTAEPISLKPNTRSDDVDIDNLNNLAEESAQNADDLEVTQNVPSINETSKPEAPTTKSTFYTKESTDTEQNNALADTLPEVTTIPNVTQHFTSEPNMNTDGKECKLRCLIKQ